MYVFTDESGQFTESTTSEWGILVICTITDKSYDMFSQYYMGLFGSDWHLKKASQLDFACRDKLLRYIGKHDEIRYSAFVYDHKATSDTAITQHKQGQIKKLEDAIEKIRPIAKHASYIKDLELLRNQLRKSSTSDYLKIIMTFTAYRNWFQTFHFDYFYTNVSRDSWNMKHIFDMQSTPEKFVRLVYSLLVLTTNGLAGAEFPIYFPVGWSLDHPLYKNYNTTEGTDMRKFLSNRKCGDDRHEIGLKIPDLISNTLLRSIQRQDEIRWLRILRRIIPNRSFVHKKGKGEDCYKIITFRGELENQIPSDKIKNHTKLIRTLYRT